MLMAGRLISKNCLIVLSLKNLDRLHHLAIHYGFWIRLLLRQPERNGRGAQSVNVDRVKSPVLYEIGGIGWFNADFAQTVGTNTTPPVIVNILKYDITSDQLRKINSDYLIKLLLLIDKVIKFLLLYPRQKIDSNNLIHYFVWYTDFRTQRVPIMH